MVSDLSSYDLWDWGAGANSMQFAVETIGARRPLGLNLSVDVQRLNEMRASGFETRELDVLTIAPDERTDYITASHFFEHLPDDAACELAVVIMLRSARRGVYISGPTFDEDDLARQQGFKFFWADWDDHRSHFGLKRLMAILERLGVWQYTVSLGFPVLSCQDAALLDVNERPNINGHDETCLPKNEQELWRPLYQEFALSIAASPDENTHRWHTTRHGPAGVACYELVHEFSRWPDTQLAKTMILFTR